MKAGHRGGPAGCSGAIHARTASVWGGPRRAVTVVLVSGALGLALAACGSGGEASKLQRSGRAGARTHDPVSRLGSVPPLLSRRDVYAADAPGKLSGVARRFRARVYVPNSG